LDDHRELVRLVGECRDLGDDGLAWRAHLIAELARLLDADMGMSGEMAGCLASRPTSLGVTFWGWQTGFIPMTVFDSVMEAFRDDPEISTAMVGYCGQLVGADGISLARTDFLADRSWYPSDEYQVILRSYGVDHTLWCFRSIGGSPVAEHAGTVLSRAEGRRDFDARDRLLVHEVVVALTPLIGGALARFAEPSPRDLAPRVRKVLACLLEGDGDKQMAARLGISPYTVNQYVKQVYRHFGVRSRPELLARWIRRGWGVRKTWVGDSPATSGA